MGVTGMVSGAIKTIGAFDLWCNYEAKVKRAADYIRPHLMEQPVFGVVLGSGLGELASQIKDSVIIPYSSIPGFPRPTVSGHAGNMHIGRLAGVPVIGLEGRIHYYEGADLPFNAGVMRSVFPVHVLADLLVPNYFVTNAAGGLNIDYQIGDIMVIESHINIAIPSPLLGRVRDFKRIDGKPIYEFQPMDKVYDMDLRSMLVKAASEFKGHVHIGTYEALTGRQYETKGESNMLRNMVADTVGMSTTPEVLAAASRGMNVVGFSTITNKIAADGTNATNHEEVKAILASAVVKERLAKTVINFFEMYGYYFMDSLE